MSGSGDHDHDDESYVVKLRGLPWSTTVDEIRKFFSDCSIKDGKLGIHMTMSREGRPSGEAYVEMETDEDIERACKKDRDHMGHRYIEGHQFIVQGYCSPTCTSRTRDIERVFKAKRSEMEWVVKRSGLNLENAMDDGCVRLRGLPFGCSKEEIAQFFSGLEIVPNGISLPTDYTGRSTGEAYVQFLNKEVAEKALQKHKDKIGHRYIEIFRSSLSEVRAAIGPKMRPLGPGGFNQRPAPYDRGDRFGGMNRYNNMGRGSRSFKGFGDFDDGPSPWGFNSSWGGGGGGPGLRGNLGGRGGSGINMNLNMNSGGFGGLGGLGRGGRSGGGGGNWNANGGGMGGGGGHCIHMRGLPFRATQADIADFFRPFTPMNIRLLYDNSGRASGEADVEFATHEEAVKAMSKDKGHMQHRYIELFLNSTPGNSGGGGLGGGNFGGMGGGGFGGGSGGGGFGGGLGSSFQRGYSNNLGSAMGYSSQMGGSNYSSF